MSRLVEVRVPDMGSFSDVAVIDVLVKPGEAIEREASLVTLETEKATMDVPSDVAGVIEKVHVAKGGTVSAGDVVATVRAEDGNGAGGAAAGGAASSGAGGSAAGAPQGASASNAASEGASSSAASEGASGGGSGAGSAAQQGAAGRPSTTGSSDASASKGGASAATAATSSAAGAQRAAT